MKQAKVLSKAEISRVVAVIDAHRVEDLLTRSTPAAVAIEVDPGIQLRATCRVLHVDRHTCIQLAHLDRAERHTVFVVRDVAGLELHDI